MRLVLNDVKIKTKSSSICLNLLVRVHIKRGRTKFGDPDANIKNQIPKFVFFPIALKPKNEGYPTQTARIPLSLYKQFFYSITIL